MLSSHQEIIQLELHPLQE